MMKNNETLETASFTGHINLAAEQLGAEVLAANDEFFAPKDNLISPGRGVLDPDAYTDHGKLMDGWETRRRRTPGHDYCVVALGLRGFIRGVDIDTNHFLGNHPPHASIEACDHAGMPDDETVWREVLGKSALKPGSQNLFEVKSDQAWSHVRLNIYPDGGVARLRVYGEVTPDWSGVADDACIDLAAVERGGWVLACSDMFFSPKDNIIMPGEPDNMGCGWETKRRRGPGHDWTIVQLGSPGVITKLDIGTIHYKGNYPDSCSVEQCYAPGEHAGQQLSDDASWRELLPQTKLKADTHHLFESELVLNERCTHLRLNIFPDGGISRFRAWGIREAP